VDTDLIRTEPNRTGSIAMQNIAHAPAPLSHSETGAFEPLAEAARLAMRLGSLVGFGLLCLPAAFPVTLVARRFELGLAGGIGIWLLLALGLLIYAWWYGGARWRHAGVRLEERGIAIRKGVFWRSETFVPRSRIQHTDIKHGPIERGLGLATLKLYTAGSRLAAIEVEGLDETRAAALRDALVSDDDDAT
jgi:uncharacterized protein